MASLNVNPKTMYVITTLDGGGAERLLTNILLHLPEPERITVVSLLAGGVFRPALEDAGIHVTDLGMVKHRDAFRGIRQLAALIRSQRPEIVHGWMYHANLLAFFAVLLAGRPRPRQFWGIFCTDAQSAHLHWTFRIVRRLNAILSRRVEGIVYNAAEARDFHHRIGFRERSSVVITNHIDPEVFQRDAQQRGALRSELGIREDDVVIAAVARVDPMKDWRTLRDAVRDLPRVITLAAGKGTDELPRQPGFIGLGWRDDVVRILSAADIFLLASAFGEGMSLALGEAMLCGLPCIVTDVGGNSALVGDGGIVVQPGDVAAMREAIVQLVADRERRLALGRAARERASREAVA
jgi:glycosyltransferase involved in cell wall biosynthesis